MVAAFPVDKLPPINGHPSLHTLFKALKIITRCSQKIKSGLGSLGCLFVALPPLHYQRFTNVPLVLLGPTPAVPQYTPKMNPVKRDATKLQCQAHKAEINNICNMNKALTSLLLYAIHPTFKRLQQNPFGMCYSPFLTVTDA